MTSYAEWKECKDGRREIDRLCAQLASAREVIRELLECFLDEPYPEDASIKEIDDGEAAIDAARRWLKENPE